MSEDPSHGDGENAELTGLILAGSPLIDVRAPVEFASGKIPGAVNLPLLDDEQRALIGTKYKMSGSDAAIAQGHELISGQVRESRLDAWSTFAKANPSAWFYCFRGGLRSQMSAQALAEIGIRLPIIEGGYKRFRQFAMSVVDRAAATEEFIVISGFTGSGKTDLLREHASELRVCDLERAAHHRGSSFGSFSEAQSSQADFENEVAVDFLRAREQGARTVRPIMVEDESRLIGRNVIPPALFNRMMSAPMIVIERPRPERARRLIHSYLRENYGLEDGNRNESLIARLSADILRSLNGIERRLGGVAHTSLTHEVTESLRLHGETGLIEVHLPWVERLLELYYDPLYLHHIGKQASRVIARGSPDEVLARLKGYKISPTSGHTTPK